MVDPGTAEASFEVVRWAARNSMVKKAIDWVRPKYHVLVVGTSGVGKTNFLDSLIEPSARAIKREDRTKFMNRRTLALPHRTKPFVFWDTPGEQGQIHERTKAILGLSRRRGSFGVINVVAYGYVETDSVPASTALLNGAPDPGYLARKRDEEVSVLAGWVQSVSARQVDYFVTLVTKADLWYPERIDVVDHYTNGQYSQVLHSAGIANHVVIEYASTIHKFFGTAVSGDFDLDNLLDLRERFQREIVRAVTR